VSLCSTHSANSLRLTVVRIGLKFNNSGLYITSLHLLYEVNLRSSFVAPKTFEEVMGFIDRERWSSIFMIWKRARKVHS